MVEDHVFFSRAFELVLERRLSDGGPPPEFRHAATVADGLRIAAEAPFDLASVDLVLPDGDGAEVVRKIKGSHPETPVAVLSSALDLSGVLEAGADEVIGKMDDLQQTVATLARLVDGGGRTAP